jgi:2-polyprenyl-3-methyl-5-hydroxy-6-metoxy-1,4-benzoquinol methylase
MITSRIQQIIQREKFKNPQHNALFLLLGRVFSVIAIRLKHSILKLRKDSTFKSAEEMYMCNLFPKKAIDIVISNFEPESVIDIGCGQGISLKYFIDNKIDAIGIENSKLAISLSPVKSKIIRFDLRKELNLKKEYGLVWCFEVIEHIHPKYETNFLKSLINHSKIIILSAAKPGQGGHGHFNEQKPQYWIEQFSKYNFIYDECFSKQLQSIDDMHCENLLCFKYKN